MTDYGREDRQRFLRQVHGMRALHAFYIAVIGLAIGGALAVIISLFSRGH